MQNDLIRNQARVQAKRNRIRQSLIHARDTPEDVLSLSIVPQKYIYSLEEVLRRFDIQELALAKELYVSGDKRLQS